ncbi:hypothetical protein ID866_4544 [Astraeus odoratus]|nr:hypothetical protein ID866_4544 [Astraeus odoratus]
MDDYISSPLNIQRFAIDIAQRLSSLRDFLEASEQFMKHDDLFTDAVIKQHGRKVGAAVFMLDVARMTLNRAGLKLHLFTSCPPKYQPFKSAYFKMLVLLRQHREEFSLDLLGRVDRLILPLTTRLVICHNSDPYAQLGIAESMKKLATTSQPKQPPLETPGGQHKCVPSWPTNNLAASMPPPDAFPPKPSLREERSRQHSRKRLHLGSGQSRPVHRQHPQRPAPDSPSGDGGDSTAIPPRVLTRARRHFGIFCTGKSQSQRPWNRSF